MSRQEPKEPSPQTARRWSTFRRTVTLRLVLSWTRWRRKKAERRLARLERLALMEAAIEAEREKIKELEQRAVSPVLVIPEPDHDPTPEELAPGMLMMQPPPEAIPEPHPGIPTPHTDALMEDLEMPDPSLEIAQRIGLPPPRS